jgi:predicted RNA methylase
MILGLMGDLAGCRVLDAGCGDGGLICAAALRGAAATGIDPDPAMLPDGGSRGSCEMTSLHDRRA